MTDSKSDRQEVLVSNSTFVSAASLFGDRGVVASVSRISTASDNRQTKQIPRQQKHLQVIGFVHPSYTATTLFTARQLRGLNRCATAQFLKREIYTPAAASFGAIWVKNSGCSHVLTGSVSI